MPQQQLTNKRKKPFSGPRALPYMFTLLYTQLFCIPLNFYYNSFFMSLKFYNLPYETVCVKWSL